MGFPVLLWGAEKLVPAEYWCPYGISSDQHVMAAKSTHWMDFSFRTSPQRNARIKTLSSVSLSHNKRGVSVTLVHYGLVAQFAI